ncbi:class I SAM-dependent methyltransferase [Shewanella indica]|uniref:class I SAM-dependent methyltransferase n=1 Tax=Shewanella indica TaxID=768528 RepID=UPI001BEDD4A4|nr:class I SAM-dependent methyltransferase [Shewanella indica]MCE9790521.1 class I SAM-dependent methyltransferase [Shewanella indica]BCV36290.1 SAM-dependent methyltransferase [Shewanella chilikensis]
MDKYRETVATFDKMALSYRDKFAGNDCYDSAHNRFASLLKQYQACAGRRLRLLDIGCGPGHVSGTLVDRVPELEIVGIDAAPAMVALAGELLPEGRFYRLDSRKLGCLTSLLETDAVQAIAPLDVSENTAASVSLGVSDGSNTLDDLEDLDTPEGFDAILLLFVTPYLERQDVMTLLQDCRALLNDGGLLYLASMEDDYQESGYQSSSSGDRVFIHYYPEVFFVSELAAAGFELIDSLRKPYLEQGEVKATDLFLYAKAV